MSSATPAQAERALRRRIRSSFIAWANFALARDKQAPATHHLAMIEALERVARGETRRLLLMLPPGSAKSTYASVLFPVWWFVRHPKTAVITACHTASLAEHFGRKVRSLMEEHAARLNIAVRPDARAACRLLTARGGEYFAIGVNGGVTGRRADLALIDDPVRSFAEAESFAARERLWNWFRSELMTRLKPNGRVVLIMTRWHPDDLAGRLMEQGGWEALRLPAIAEAEDPLGRAPGEALWPTWEDVPALRDKETALGERAFAAMYQQSPRLQHGMMFDTRHVSIVDRVESGTAVRAWDMAATDGGTGTPDWTVGVKLVREASGLLCVDDIVRVQVGPGHVADIIKNCAEADGKHVAIGLPQDPGQAGRSQIMFLTAMLAGYRVVSRRETGAKTVRAEPAASLINNAALRIRRAPWNAAFLDELGCFPHGKKDDQVDALAYAVSMLGETATPAKFRHLQHTAR